MSSVDVPMNPCDDKENTSMTLIEAAMKLDAESWTRFDKLYSPFVRAWCAKTGLKGADLDDVCQEVFQSVVIGINKYSPDGKAGSFRRWLWVVTKHRVHKFYSKRNRGSTALGGSVAKEMIEAYKDPFAPDMNAFDEDTSEPKELKQIYLRAIDLVRNDFEPTTWQCFLLTTIDRKTTQEVAEALGLTEAAVRKNKSRVKKRIQLQTENPLA